MAKETTKKTTKVASACKQYVVEELKQAKEILESLKRENELLKKVVKDLNRLIELGTKDFELRLEIGDYTGKEQVCVYWNNDYLGLSSLDDLKNNTKLYDLVMLIKKGQTRVEREQ